MLSRDLLGSLVNVVNCFAEINARHLSVYLCLYISATSLPLPYFKITLSSRFDSLGTISLYLYETFTLQYFSHVFLSLVFITLRSFSGMCDTFRKRIWKNCSNSVNIAFLLIFVGYNDLIHMLMRSFLLLLKHTMRIYVPYLSLTMVYYFDNSSFGFL